jgi:NAD(P)-dependent dehydrogenase (short-subunit alcohol dehydrogenase family)
MARHSEGEMDFSNQTVVVTGAAGNLGRAVASAFAERKANVVLVDLRIEKLAERFGDENDRRLFAAADLGQQSQAVAVVPRMLEQGGGKVVNVGAYAARRGVANMGAYCASKAVVIRLTEAMAAELRERNINVNCVLPSTLDTPENRAEMPDADPSRWVAPADLAQAIVFLASPAARAIHGAALPVTGLS